MDRSGSLAILRLPYRFPWYLFSGILTWRHSWGHWVLMSGFVRSDMKENCQFHSLLEKKESAEENTAQWREEYNEWRSTFGRWSHIRKCYWSAGISWETFGHSGESVHGKKGESQAELLHVASEELCRAERWPSGHSLLCSTHVCLDVIRRIMGSLGNEWPGFSSFFCFSC